MIDYYSTILILRGYERIKKTAEDAEGTEEEGLEDFFIFNKIYVYPSKLMWSSIRGLSHKF